jgi:hypothetical protein
MRVLAATLIAAKNALSDDSPWLWIFELQKTSWYQLRYSSLTTPFTPGATLTEASAGALIQSIWELTDTSGFLIISTVTGDGIFTAGEIITDGSGGNAIIDRELNTTTADPIICRFVRNQTTIEYDGQIYDPMPFSISMVRFGNNQFPSVDVALSNVLQMPEMWLRAAGGFLKSQVRLAVVYHGDLTSDPAFDQSFQVLKSKSNREAIILTCGRKNILYEPFPRMRYSRKRCRWGYKVSTADCKATSTSTSCDRSLSDCIDRANTSRFGGFPAIPGGFFDV